MSLVETRLPTVKYMSHVLHKMLKTTHSFGYVILPVVD